MQDEAFLCLKIMPHLPTQPKRQAVGTETHQGALLWEQELARQPVLSQPSLPVTHPVFEDVDFFFFPLKSTMVRIREEGERQHPKGS